LDINIAPGLPFTSGDISLFSGLGGVAALKRRKKRAASLYAA